MARPRPHAKMDYIITTTRLHHHANLQDSVPVTVSYFRHETLDAVHCVESDGSLFLQSGQRPQQIVLFQVLLNQPNHAAIERERERESFGWKVEQHTHSADSISSAMSDDNKLQLFIAPF